jgi:hypothetical protein
MRSSKRYVKLLFVLFFSISPLCALDAQSMIEAVTAFTRAGNGPFQEPVSELLDEVAHACVVVREGSDADQRPIFVNAQADCERAIVSWLKSKEIAHVVCIIHTPAPATPLCTNGDISAGLVDPAILNDQARLLTVKKRPDIIRDYLEQGGYLFTVYPKNGRNLRSSEQLAILEDLMHTHPDRLKAIELDCAEIPRDLIGATYLICLSNAQNYVLSFRSYQANSPTDDRWAIWFGPLHEKAVAERFDAVETFLRDRGFPFRSYLPISIRS